MCALFRLVLRRTGCRCVTLSLRHAMNPSMGAREFIPEFDGLWLVSRYRHPDFST